MTPHMSLRRTAASLLAALTIGCGGSSDDTTPGVVRNPLLQPDRFAETAPARYLVRVETSDGEVVIEVHRDWAPIGADRFYNLAKGGYYDDSRIYRVLAGFMAQFGLNEDPYVSQAWKTQFLVDDPANESNTRGRVAFAQGGRHTRTTEIFINYKNNSTLDGEGFTPFGEVVEGMDIVDAFYADYGDGPPRGDGPYQAMAAARGNAYLDVDFPGLTKILKVTVTPTGD